ncbi:MAG TPA: sugar phosphate nucleotidyltransferase [Candidatus Saccharimonadales bacterium]|nr:sugar phosphate nucleotidyltransferase [Candidatus Saccharimonadales bacterium]
MPNRVKIKPVRKAVIAAAGFGTRLLPQTKAMPKEMLPLVDKPIVQYIVEELVEAGIEDIVIVTGYHKRAIEDHFDQINADLLANLQQGSKQELIDEINSITLMANFAFVRQHKGPYGSARPILNVAHLIGPEPFIYAFADDLIVVEPNRFQQMIDLYNETGGCILPSVRVEKDEDFDRYGIIEGEEIREGVVRASKILEKPGKSNTTSNLASAGGYLLTPDAFEFTERAVSQVKDGEEFYLTSFVVEPMIENGYPFYALELKNSTYYDTGDKLEYLKTVVDFGLMRDDIKADFAEFLRGRIT